MSAPVFIMDGLDLRPAIAELQLMYGHYTFAEIEQTRLHTRHIVQTYAAALPEIVTCFHGPRFKHSEQAKGQCCNLYVLTEEQVVYVGTAHARPQADMARLDLINGSLERGDTASVERLKACMSHAILGNPRMVIVPLSHPVLDAPAIEHACRQALSRFGSSLKSVELDWLAYSKALALANTIAETARSTRKEVSKEEQQRIFLDIYSPEL